MFALTACLIGLLSPTASSSTSGAAEPGIGLELLRDPGFELGFTVLGAQPGVGEIGRFRTATVPGAPIWELAQWHSRVPFTNFVAPDAGSLCVSNEAKWLLLERRPPGPPRLTFGVDSRSEYAGQLRRSSSEPWVHLLVQQEVENAPSLAELAELRLRFEACLNHAETFRPQGYTRSLHAAQFQIVLTLNNARHDSPGFGDYLWFVVPVYDDRYDVPPEYIARDFAVTKGKLIYNPGAAALGLSPLRSGEWRTVELELRSWLELALKAAWSKGYLHDSRDPFDYRVTHLNLGWEVPGLNRVEMNLRGLSLRAWSH